MSKSSKPNVEQNENQTPEADQANELQPKLSRLEQFLKDKAAKQNPFGKDKGLHPHGKSGHAKLKERVRRRP